MSGKPDSEVDFGVVGAGLGGIRTALALLGSGASVAVFEARERVGGRVFSAPPAAGGADEPPLALDLGAQWVGPGQTQILSSSRNWTCTLSRPARRAGRSGASAAACGGGGRTFPRCRRWRWPRCSWRLRGWFPCPSASRRIRPGKRPRPGNGTAFRRETGYAGICTLPQAGILPGSISPGIRRSTTRNVHARSSL